MAEVSLAPTQLPLSQPPVRGRPRSTSISSGSPSPCSASPSSSSSLTPELPPPLHSSSHRSTLSVPSALNLSGLSIPPRRHRRTQSVSPPGFPIISEVGENGFAPSGGGGSALGLGGMGLGEERRSSSPAVVSLASTAPSSATQPIEIRRKSLGNLHAHLTASPQSHTHRTHSGSSSTSSSPTSTTSSSPTSSLPHFHSHHSHHNHHHQQSHAALLLGIRSHALPSPHSTIPPPIPTSIPVGGGGGGQFINPFSSDLSTSPPPFVHPPVRTSFIPSLQSQPQSHNQPSPPFGPTPLSTSIPIPSTPFFSSPSIDDDYPCSTSPNEPLPGAFETLSSSTLLSPPELQPSPSSRPRSGSFGNDATERPIFNTTTSPASLYLSSTSPPSSPTPLIANCGGRISPPLLELFGVGNAGGGTGVMLMPLSEYAANAGAVNVSMPMGAFGGRVLSPPPPLPLQSSGVISTTSVQEVKEVEEEEEEIVLIPIEEESSREGQEGLQIEEEIIMVVRDGEKERQEEVERMLLEAGRTEMDLSGLGLFGNGSGGEEKVEEGEITLEGGMEVDSHSMYLIGDFGGPEDRNDGAGGEGGDPSIAIEEESLSALERIFVCAKSEIGKERARVAHHLAEWLEGVEMSEAVEYALPLLAGLATDPEDLVKEVFAPQLDRIMWHFFWQCPLQELDSQDSPSSSPHSPVGSPVPSRYTPHSPTSSNSPPSAPTTSKTSPSNTETPDPPKISVTTFTSLLGALLTDQSTKVASLTQATLVRFLCRLKGISPHHDGEESGEYDDDDDDWVPKSKGETTYCLNDEARRLLEDEFITGIVLGLARLDDDDDDDDEGDLGVGGRRRRHSCSSNSSDSSDSRVDSRLASSSHNNNSGGEFYDVDTGTLSGSLVMSPEEELIEDGGWSQPAQLNGSNGTLGPTAEGWGEPLISYFNDGTDSDSIGGRRTSNDFSRLLPSSSMSPPDQVYSSFSPDAGGHIDEESAIGKLVSMSLITAITGTDCLSPEVLEEQLLPEVGRMRSEPMFYVRKEAVQALASLSRRLSLDAFEPSVLPLHAAFARDTLWHVRRAACLALPTICKRLSGDLLRTQVVTNIRLFSDDPSRNVRSAALEVCGELIYLFYGDPSGVPEELLAFFLGQSISPAQEQQKQDQDEVFAPLQTALDSPPQTFFDPSAWAPSTLFKVTRDPDRPVMCAFNLPAVALTLGRDNWHLLKDYYSTLCCEKADKVRQSLASSMHEIAKIIGPEQADVDLVEPLSMFLKDYDFIQGALLESLPSLLCSLGPIGGNEALLAVSDAWGAIKNWRRREALAKELGHLTAHFIVLDQPEQVLSLLGKAFKDPVATVREEAVYAIPTALHATEVDSPARNKLCAFLGVFSEDSSYRNRVTFTSCALATIRSGAGRNIFEPYFLDALGRLARDKVMNVRLGVARVMAEACRSCVLYPEPSMRAPILDILHTLAVSADRDVLALISEFYTLTPPQPTQPPPSPPPSGLDRSGAQSRMDMYDSESEDDSGHPLPVAQRSNPDLHGVIDHDDEMSEISLDPPTTSELAESGDGDVEMDEGVLLESATAGDSSPVMVSSALSWRELEDEDDEFLEVAAHR